MPDRKVTVRLHRSIYPARALTVTTVAFAELVEADISRDGDYHEVVLRPLGDAYTPEQLRHEFANFALSRAARSR
jgi:hypothetical protein